MKTLCLFIIMISTLMTRSQMPKMEGSRLILENPVTFKSGADELTDEGKLALKPVKDFLATRDNISLLRVEGHTDNTGDPADSHTMTQKRALAICKWLVANGIDCKRLIAVGFGSTKPIDDNNTPMGRAANRRIEFVMAGLRGKLIGGMPADGGGIVAGDPCEQ